MADQGTEGLLSSFLRKRRINAIKPFLKGKILDVGCGTGVLANLVLSDLYIGVDIDLTSINLAKEKYPYHRFYLKLPSENEKFDSIVSLATIEHIAYPVDFLTKISKLLTTNSDSTIIITTPNPFFEKIYSIGVYLGLFSKHANEEHEELLGYTRLNEIADLCNLKMTLYKRFLFGANQLALFKLKK
ncbi:MAG: class I SAM-dependent methyltransferase [Bacteroidota bacterium]